jgi:hypothetical protein
MRYGEGSANRKSRIWIGILAEDHNSHILWGQVKSCENLFASRQSHLAAAFEPF